MLSLAFDRSWLTRLKRIPLEGIISLDTNSESLVALDSIIVEQILERLPAALRF